MFQEQFGLKAQLQNGNRLTLPFSTTSRRTSSSSVGPRTSRAPASESNSIRSFRNQTGARDVRGPTEELESFQRSVLLKGTLI